MSREYKLNKSELTRLKQQEKLYLQYLPVLKLKQEQLQIEQNRIKKSLRDARLKSQETLLKLAPYIPFFADQEDISLQDVVVVSELSAMVKNIAGVSIKVFKSLSFKDIELPYFQTSPWLIGSVPIVKAYLQAEAHVRLLNEEDRVVQNELRKTTQKVNLFDQVLVPNTKMAIRRIKIALQDEEVAMVSRGKIAKARKTLVSMLAEEIS